MKRGKQRKKGRKNKRKKERKKEKIQLEEISLSVNWHGEWLSGDNYLKEGIVHDYC